MQLNKSTTVQKALIKNVPFAKLDLLPVFQGEKMPPDERVVEGVHISSDERPPPIHLQNNTDY